MFATSIFSFNCSTVLFDSVKFERINLISENLFEAGVIQFSNVFFTSANSSDYLISITGGETNLINCSISASHALGFISKNSSSTLNIKNVNVGDCVFHKYLFTGDHSLTVSHLHVGGGKLSLFNFEKCNSVLLDSIVLQDTIPITIMIRISGFDVNSSFSLTNFTFAQYHEIVSLLDSSTILDINGFETLSMENIILENVNTRMFASIGTYSSPKNVFLNRFAFSNITSRSDFLYVKFLRACSLTNLALENGFIDDTSNNAFISLVSHEGFSDTHVYVTNITVDNTFVHYEYAGTYFCILDG